MLFFPDRRVGILPRHDRSLGWSRLVAKQSAALGRRLSKGSDAIVSFPSYSAAISESYPPIEPEKRALRIARLALEALALALAFYILATSLLVACYRFVDPPSTVLMAYRKYGYGWKIEAPRPKPLKTTPAYIRRMLVSVEDYKFYEHHGIDFEAFKNAREMNARVGKPLYGGSTLTMQVARTLFLVPVKSYARKGLEVIVAFELEAFLSKDRILELYLGYAEWGKGVFGIESAARKWFKTGVQGLSRDEAARLIALLSSPIKYSPLTLSRNGILRERYAYLSRRYVAQQRSPVAASPSQPEPPQGSIDASPNALPAPDAATEDKGPATDQPPPSPEPDNDASTPSAEAEVAPTPSPQ